MKYFFYFLGFLTPLFIGLYFLIFTASGNSFVKPYLQKELQKNILNKVHIESFTLKTNFIDIEIILDDKSRIIVNGDFSLLQQSFDLNYILALKNIKSRYADIDGIIALKGDVKGKLNSFALDGEGEVLNAKTKVNVQVIDRKPTQIVANIKGLHIEKVLKLLKKPVYSRGFLDITANLKPTLSQNLKGDGVIDIHFGTLNSSLIEKDFDVKLPLNVTYRGNINFDINEEILNATSDISSNILLFEGRDTKINLETQELYSQYMVNFLNLGYLKETIGVDLFGSLRVHGDIKKEKDSVKVNAFSKTLGGEVIAKLEDERAKLSVKNVLVTELFKMLKQERYATGVINSTVDVSDLSKLDFTSTTTIQNAYINGKTLEKVLKKDGTPSRINYEVNLEANGENKVIDINSVIDSDLATLKIEDTNYNVDQKLLYGKYILGVNSFENLEFLTSKKLQGKLNTQGEFKRENAIFSLKGFSDFLDSKTEYSLDNDIIKLNSNELLIQNVAQMLQYPSVFESYSSVDLDYNLSNKKGSFNIEAVNGKLTSSELTTIVSALTGFDMMQEIYKDSKIKGLINDKLIDFTVGMNGMNSYLKMEQGRINLANESLNTKFDVKVGKKDVKGDIKGNLSKPKVSIKNSSYIKHKIDKAIDKNVPQEWREPAKELLKLFG